MPKIKGQKSMGQTPQIEGEKKLNRYPCWQRPVFPIDIGEFLQWRGNRNYEYPIEYLINGGWIEMSRMSF